MPRVNFGNTLKIERWIRRGEPDTVKQFGELIARRLADLGKDSDQFAPYPWDGQEPGNVNVASWRECVKNAEGDEQIEIIGRWKATIDDHFRAAAHSADVPVPDHRSPQQPPGIESPAQETHDEETSAHEPHATKDSTIAAARIMGLCTVAAGVLGVGVPIMLSGRYFTGAGIVAGGLLLALLTLLYPSRR